MVGAHVAVQPMQSLNGAPEVDWVAVGEFDHACAEVAAGKPLRDVQGIAYRDNGQIRFSAPRPTLEDMDSLPFVVDVYKRDLTIENYFIGYLMHPYVSLYTGRGCRSKCTFCLWPQTLGGHRYRVRSVDNVEAEMKRAKELFPQVKEFFFDDDTFTDDLPRAEEIAKRLSKLGLTWSCNAKANVPRKSLEVLRENGLRLLLVGTNREPANPEQHQEGHAHRCRARVHQERQGTGHHHSRHLHSRLARRDARDHSANGPLRLRHQSPHDSGLSVRALSRHRALSPGAGAGLVADPRRR
jgi:hypothetical protein